MKRLRSPVKVVRIGRVFHASADTEQGCIPARGFGRTPKEAIEDVRRRHNVRSANTKYWKEFFRFYDKEGPWRTRKHPVFQRPSRYLKWVNTGATA